jgi:hypothetical protein
VAHNFVSYSFVSVLMITPCRYSWKLDINIEYSSALTVDVPTMPALCSARVRCAIVQMFVSCRQCRKN